VQMLQKKHVLGPGDSIVSSPENLFDLAGVYPLKMRIAGVLEKSHSADDLAVFVDVRTVWIIEGLGHGHEDLKKVVDKSVLLAAEQNSITANAKLNHFTEITAGNRSSFHFHGDTSSYPITAVLAVPHDKKSETILRGRYIDSTNPLQIIQPVTVIDALLQNIFRIKNVLDAVIAIVAFATVLTIILVFILSFKLREKEIGTIFKIGCSKLTTAKLLGAEVSIVVVTSAAFCALFVLVCAQFSSDIVRALFI